MGDFFPGSAPDPFNPRPGLSGLDGGHASGVWKLFVLDDHNGNDSDGFIQNWSLQVMAKVKVKKK
jgi:hypothetical protein